MGAIAQQVCVVVSAAEREQLAAIAADRNRPRKHLERARMVASADRYSAQQVAQSIGISRPTVWRWQQFVLRQLTCMCLSGSAVTSGGATPDFLSDVDPRCYLCLARFRQRRDPALRAQARDSEEYA
jgi:hypothetical protein